MPLVSGPVVVAGARSGAVVAFPTDTVPALAVMAGRGEKIYQLKQRPAHKPLILMAASWSELSAYVEGSHGAWDRVIERYWPGALTIVLPANDRGRALNSSATIGLRVPDLPAALGILQQTGPLLTTSANVSGAPPLETMEAIAADFPGVLTLDNHLDRGRGLPSTVISWEQNRWQVLRQGDVQFSPDT